MHEVLFTSIRESLLSMEMIYFETQQALEKLEGYMKEKDDFLQDMKEEVTKMK